MDIIVTRVRLAGAALLFEYRALVPWAALSTDRQAILPPVRGPHIAGRAQCVRLAPLIAPDRYFAMSEPERSYLARRIGLVARRVETLVVRAVFPEMTADMLPIHYRGDHETGDACHCVPIIDLATAFDRLEPALDALMACDLGLYQGCAQNAA
ncbi:hypothetical protein [Sphingobium estronivorans]|uniref:hypothetical protein n=1 Tax=Sphingobium estronivorans TaxID=1577690 RepID=UPI00123A86C2|nr:hypothetical protein [Sphingobium estronivorans]